MAAGDRGERGRCVTGTTATATGKKENKQTYLSKTRGLGARPAMGAGGEQEERLRQP